MKAPRRYSKNFLRDWYFYTENLDRFTFCGSGIPIPVHKIGGVSALVAFWQRDTLGSHDPTCQPMLLRRVLLAKASVNFQILQWAEGRADLTLPGCELRSYLNRIVAPQWMATAIEKQRWNCFDGLGRWAPA